MNEHKQIDKMLVDYALGALSDQQAERVRRHVSDCQACRSSLARLAELNRHTDSIRSVSASDQACRAANDAVLAATLTKARPSHGHETRAFVERTIMRNHWTKLSAAAALIVAVGVGLWALGRTGTSPAYALQQTIEAHHDVRSIHMKILTPNNTPFAGTRIWAEFDDTGALLRGRYETIGDTHRSDLGPFVGVCEDGRETGWNKGNNVAVVRPVGSAGGVFESLAETVDLTALIRRLASQEADGKLTVDIQEPTTDGEAIVITTAPTEEATSPATRYVVTVDEDTLLVSRVELYTLEDQRYTLARQFEVIAYNEAIDPAMFTLDLPEDVILTDQLTQQVGMAQGDMTDEQVARAVVRAFVDAILAEDYARAARLLGGLPEETVRKRMTSGPRLVRIVSIGKPTPNPNGLWLDVHTKIEVEDPDGGDTATVTVPWSVRRLDDQPGRWTLQW